MQRESTAGNSWPQFDVSARPGGTAEDHRAAKLAQQLLDSMPAEVRQRIFDESVRLGSEALATGRAFDSEAEAQRIAEELAVDWLRATVVQNVEQADA